MQHKYLQCDKSACLDGTVLLLFLLEKQERVVR